MTVIRVPWGTVIVGGMLMYFPMAASVAPPRASVTPETAWVLPPPVEIVTPLLSLPLSSIIAGMAEIVEISAAAFPDPTEPEGTRWVAVKVKPLYKLPHPVTLAQAKAEPRLSDMALVRQSRLSVSPVTDAEWAVVMELAGKA